MKFLVPTTFENEFISKLLQSDKKEVCSLYGKLAADFVGGGRPSFILPSVGKKKLQEHIERVHKNGLEFDYLLNSVCLGNREFTISGQKRIRSLLDWLVKIKVDAVTVALPYLASLIRRKYPQLKVYVSVRANVDSLLKAKYWQDLGADLIILHSILLNRDFKSLEKIRKYIKCKLALIANDACVYRCPINCYHYALTSHASQEDACSKGYWIDYCVLVCKQLRLEEPVNIIRAIWIRPEDVHYYEDIGIDYLKLSGRSMDGDFILRTVNAYSARYQGGNLADILPLYNKRFARKGIKKHIHSIRYLFKPFAVNVFRIHKFFHNDPLRIHIDNRALDGFLEFFVHGNCKRGLCEECGYCKEITEKAVTLDKEYRSKASLEYKNVLDDIILGTPFKYH